MNSIEIMALIVAVISMIKIIVILINPKYWKAVAHVVCKNQVATTVIALVLAVVVLRYLLTELNILQIFATMLFLILLMAVSFSSYSKEMLQLTDKVLSNRDVLKKGWVPIIIWLALIAWVLYYIIFI